MAYPRRVQHRAFTIRAFTPDDATAADGLLAQAFAGFEHDFSAAAEALARGTLVLSQTGSALLVADDAEGVAGLVRWWPDEGVAWLDLLVSAAPWAGAALVAAVERRAQDAGLRLVRLSAPDRSGLEAYFGRLGYLVVMRAPSADGGTPQVTMEKRLPLLTVREQRRTDAAAIAALTGEDPWVFEQGPRPGWFVLADGDRIAGAVAVRDAGAARAVVRGLWLEARYRGRGLERWMAERAAQYAETNGFALVELPATGLEPLRRAFEDARWFLEGAGADTVFVKRLAGATLAEHRRHDAGE